MRFDARELSFTCYDGLRLAGELVVPTPNRDVCVVLQQGSTLCDRDGNTPRTTAPSTLYRRIARMLAEHGISSFRYDKRQWDAAAPTPLTYSLRDRVEDLCAAWRCASEAPEVKSARVFLVGHSEGGLVAQAAAGELATDGSRIPDGVAVLASPAGTLIESLAWRADQALARGGAKLTGIGLAMHAVQHEIRRRVESGVGFTIAEFETFRDWYQARGGMNGWESWPWMREHFLLRIEEVVSQLPCPALYLHGDHDRVVSPAYLDHYRGLTAAAGKQATCEMLPGLGHYLEDSTRKAFVVSQPLVDRVAQWLLGETN